MQGQALDHLRTLDRLRNEARRALTLIELLVVLVILTTVSIVVLEGTAGKIDEAAYDKTVASLSAIRSAVIGNPLMTGDEPIVSYLADCGSFPKVPGGAQPEFYLDGLVNKPTALEEYAVRYGDGADGSGTDGDIQFYTGWRGPYISLPLNTTELLDGWNQAFEFPALGPGNEILEIQSRGGLEAPYNNPLPSVPIEFGENTGAAIDSPYFVDVSLVVNYELDAVGPTLSAKIFYPDPTDGGFFVDEKTITPTSSIGIWTPQFSDVPIGYRPVRVRIVGTTEFQTEWLTIPQGGVSGVQLTLQES